MSYWLLELIDTSIRYVCGLKSAENIGDLSIDLVE